MAFLPEDPRKQMMLLIAILAVAAGALYFNFVHRPGGVAVVELTDRVEELETQNQIAETRVGNLQVLRDDLALAERQLEALERLVPEGSEVPEIYEAIASETQSLNLTLLSIQPLPPALADSSGTLMRQEWSMTVEGDYHAIGQFLTNVARFDRIVRPQVTDLLPTGVTAGGRQLVTANFTLETFVLDPNASPPPATAPSDEASGDEGGGLVGR
ncbi:MAG: type 4a pilus biogenesis protein PilO [Gemmatimonadota bacterium]